jgi:condensin complex subunit 1
MLSCIARLAFHRKSTSLALRTRWALVQALCHAIKILSSILSDEEQIGGDDADENDEEREGERSQRSTLPSSSSSKQSVVNQDFRDAFACHLYMLFSVMFFMESESKIGSGIAKRGGGGGDSAGVDEDTVQMRAACADTMLLAAKSMGRNRFKLWKRGVADESVVVLPCRIAYQMLETASGVIARKASSGDAALGMIAVTVDSYDNLTGTILAALMDLLHSFEHMATLCAELCTMVSTNKLAMELIREVGRIDTRGSGTGDSGSKASGIKYVAPFVWELALCRPQIVLAKISHLLPHLETEPYFLRSAILTALGHIIEYIGRTLKPAADSITDSTAGSLLESENSLANLEKSRAALLDILEERSHDVSSYTRSAVLKAWIRLAQTGSIPVKRVLPVTVMAIDRLQDKTVIVRKQSLQVS